jgi:hypothetical protein
VGIDHVQGLDLALRALGHHADALAALQRAVHDPHQHHGAHVGIEPGVEDQRARRGRGVARGRRHRGDDALEQVSDALAFLGGDRQHVGGVQAHHLLDLLRHPLRIGGGQVDLVHHRDDLEARVDRQVGVRQGLRLDPLGRVDHQHGAFAGLQGARDLVGEVDVARRVDQVEHVLLAVGRRVAHARGLGLDRDAALALQVHLVEELIALLAPGERPGGVQQPVGQGALAVVDVGDDAEVADPLGIGHSPSPFRASSAAK